MLTYLCKSLGVFSSDASSAICCETHPLEQQGVKWLVEEKPQLYVLMEEDRSLSPHAFPKPVWDLGPVDPLLSQRVGWMTGVL